MEDDLLIVEELMLLLLADDGTAIVGSTVLNCLLPGAVLVELAVAGRLDVHSHRRVGGTLIHATWASRDSDLDPLLAEALAQLGTREHSAFGLVSGLGIDVRQRVLDRLVDRGHLSRETKRILGLLPTTRWPALDPRAEAALRARIVAVVDEGGAPDARTATLIALVSASQVYSRLRPPLPWNGRVAKRLKAIERGRVAGSDITPSAHEITAEIARAIRAVSSSSASAPIL